MKRVTLQKWLLGDVEPLAPEQVFAYDPDNVGHIDDLIVLGRLFKLIWALIAAACTVAILVLITLVALFDLVQAPFWKMLPLAALPFMIWGIHHKTRSPIADRSERHVILGNDQARLLVSVASDPVTAAKVLNQHFEQGKPITMGLTAAILMCRPLQPPVLQAAL